MKNKIILEEIKRINELMGTKTQLNEQLSAIIKKLANDVVEDLLQMAERQLGKTINKLSDMTETELITVLKSVEAKLIRKSFYTEIYNMIALTASKFESKTYSDLMDELANKGLKDSDLAAASLRKYAKNNGIDTLDKKFGTGGKSNTPPPPPSRGSRQTTTPSGMGAQRSFDRFKQKYPQQAEEFEDKLEVLSPSQSTRDKLLVSVNDLWDMSISELQTTIKQLEDNMTEAQLTTFNKIRKNLGKIWPGWKPVIIGVGGTFSLILVIMVGRKILNCVGNLTKCIFSTFGGIEKAMTEEEKPNQDNPTTVPTPVTQPEQGTQPVQSTDSTANW